MKEDRAEYGGRIVAALSRELSWSHFRELLPLDDPLKRKFCAEMCRAERRSVRTLRQKIGCEDVLKERLDDGERIFYALRTQLS